MSSELDAVKEREADSTRRSEALQVRGGLRVWWSKALQVRGGLRVWWSEALQVKGGLRV